MKPSASKGNFPSVTSACKQEMLQPLSRDNETKRKQGEFPFRDQRL